MKNILGALVSPAGTAWPYRLVVGFFRALLSKYGERLAIETQTPVLAVQSDRHMTHPYVIQTPRGNIRAKNVVHCTEGHVTHLLPRLRGMIWPRRGQMTVQTPGSTFPHRDGKQVWSLHFRKHFDYAMQNHNSGEIFIGGGDVAHENYSAHLVNPRDNEESIVAKSHLRGILPSVFGEEIAADEPPRVKASWTGIMGFSLDGFPLLGRLPTDALERVNQSQQGAEWVAAGFSGYGMVNSWLCGRAVAEMVLGNPIPDWLPEQFLISPQRLNALNNILESKMKLVDPFGSML
jgi:glycine/D-amino acid oxidase-like deaminating enzyme